jgi:hypothetical protein
MSIDRNDADEMFRYIEAIEEMVHGQASEDFEELYHAYTSSIADIEDVQIHMDAVNASLPAQWDITKERCVSLEAKIRALCDEMTALDISTERPIDLFDIDATVNIWALHHYYTVMLTEMQCFMATARIFRMHKPIGTPGAPVSKFKVLKGGAQ